MIFLPEGLYSLRDNVCKLKYSQKLSRRNRSRKLDGRATFIKTQGHSGSLN